MNTKIDGEFVEITWEEGGDKKVLLITPKDIVRNYHAAQKHDTSANFLPLLEECLENGKAGKEQLYAWFLGEADIIEQAVE